ncbi:MAG: DUF4254 domain-containing protein [Solirubrobacteraceae bacterium]
MSLIQSFWEVFNKSILDYHKLDNVDTKIKNPYNKEEINFLMYEKNWVDTIQWHLEDIIRNPTIDPIEALELKRKIDASNQIRTDKVELIDDWFLVHYNNPKVLNEAKLNTESLAWAIDRLSILALKIYHMQVEVNRKEAVVEHIEKCNKKLNILLEQKIDLIEAIEDLLLEIEAGRIKMKVYRQMKMYNDEELNPILYLNKNK